MRFNLVNGEGSYLSSVVIQFSFRFESQGHMTWKQLKSFPFLKLCIINP